MYTAVFIPEFPIVAWQRSTATTGPRVIVDGVAPQEKVYSLCSAAIKQGVEHGMSRAQAEAGSSAIFRIRDLSEEGTAFDRLLEVVERFTPRTECVSSPGNAYAEVDKHVGLAITNPSPISMPYIVDNFLPNVLQALPQS